MAWGKGQRQDELNTISKACRQAAKERTCPACQRGNALKITDYSNPVLIKEYGYSLIGRRCRYCGYEDDITQKV